LIDTLLGVDLGHHVEHPFRLQLDRAAKIGDGTLGIAPGLVRFGAGIIALDPLLQCKRLVEVGERVLDVVLFLPADTAGGEGLGKLWTQLQGLVEI